MAPFTAHSITVLTGNRFPWAAFLAILAAVLPLCIAAGADTQIGSVATFAFTRQANSAPFFTSDTSFAMDENRKAAGTVVAVDPDSGDGVVYYTITGGADAAKFNIDETTGVLAFTTPRNYERAADLASTDPLNDAGNNQYVVTVTATGGTGSRALAAAQTITVTVLDVDEAGTVSFSRVGRAISAKLSDPDGGVTNSSWQWARSADRTTGWTHIGGATTASYSPASDDEEKYLRATVSYADALGSGKQAQGVSTDEITPPNCWFPLSSPAWKSPGTSPSPPTGPCCSRRSMVC